MGPEAQTSTTDAALGGRAPSHAGNGAVPTPVRADELAVILADLAYNLRWSWDAPTVGLFEALAPEAWAPGHNPVAVLRAVAEDHARLEAFGERILAARAD